MKNIIIAICVLACFRLLAQENLPNISRSLYPVTTDWTSHDHEVLAWWNAKLETIDLTVERPKHVMPDISGLRMVGQVVAPLTNAEQKNQEEELTWFRAQGFNAALLVWRGEPSSFLARTAKQMKTDGWILAWTYGPEEEADVSVYVDPAQYSEACRQILPYCTFAIPTFRKATMIHFRVEDKNYPVWHRLQVNQYRRILIDLIHEAAPEIPIMGETTLRSASSYSLISSTEGDTSGNIVLEGTYDVYRLDKVAKYLHRNHVEEPWLFLITGTKPYYERIEPNWNCDLPSMWKYNVATCNVINQLKQAALVLAGGGGGTRNLWDKDLSDDLTKTTWRK